MNKKTLITIIALVLLLAGLTALYFYLKKFKTTGDLTRYLPRQTGLYIEYNLKNKDLADFRQNNFRGGIRFEKLTLDSKFFGNLSPHLIKLANKISLLIIKHNNKWQRVWLVNSDNIHKYHALVPVNYFESILDSKTIALSKSRDALKIIKKIEPLTEHTADQRKILGKFSNKNFINIY